MDDCKGYKYLGVDDCKGYKYLGMIFCPTNDINNIILRNFNKRVIHMSKFYALLDVNDSTPIEVDGFGQLCF